jgi:SAM-dependent methyltransferase
MRQATIFLESEGDRWYERNAAALEAFDPGQDLPLRLLDLYRVQPASALEVGAATGARLAALGARGAGRLVAVEPSQAAIAEGRRRHPAVEFRRALVTEMDLHEQFDLVIAHYVLHWVDRAALLGAVAAIDRCVRDGGFLLVGDFCPSAPARVPYHHLPAGAYTWKQRYHEIWTASGLYRVVAGLTGTSPRALDPRAREHERGGVWLLRKSLEDQYADAPLPPGVGPRPEAPR